MNLTRCGRGLCVPPAASTEERAHRERAKGPHAPSQGPSSVPAVCCVYGEGRGTDRPFEKKAAGQHCSPPSAVSRQFAFWLRVLLSLRTALIHRNYSPSIFDDSPRANLLFLRKRKCSCLKRSTRQEIRWQLFKSTIVWYTSSLISSKHSVPRAAEKSSTVPFRETFVCSLLYLLLFRNSL